MQLTPKQIQIMTVIVKANPDGSFADLDQILERLPYKTTKESFQFSIRTLVGKNLISKKPLEKRRGRNRVIIAPTVTGYQVMSA